MELKEVSAAPRCDEPPLSSNSSAQVTATETVPATAKTLDKAALWSLVAQHLSSSWGNRAFEFAAYLYLIILFPGTILPASIFGFLTTAAAIVFAGYVGQVVDSTPRLRFIRLAIIAQKTTVACGYSVFLILFRLRGDRSTKAWALFGLVTVVASILNVCTIAVAVSIERDWVTTVSEGDSAALTKLNTYLRRVDLLTKLLAPLFVSLLTTAVSYEFSIAIMLGYALVSMCFEWYLANVTFRRWPILAAEEQERNSTRRRLRQEHKAAHDGFTARQLFIHRITSARPNFRVLAMDWLDFIRSPVFPSSLAISLLYMTVLSFEGTFIGWAKSHDYSDPFLAGMRGVNVVTGLMGTLMMPWLEARIGVVRTGSWSIVSQLLTLIPVVISFFLDPAPEGRRAAPWNEALLFTGLALSRIGLWSFDLCQIKELQTTLQTHERKNSIMALQFSLQNVLELLKYVLTIILSRPSQFKWAALVSFCSVFLATVLYLAYARKERGHLLHLEWTKTLLGKTR